MCVRWLTGARNRAVAGVSSCGVLDQQGPSPLECGRRSSAACRNGLVPSDALRLRWRFGKADLFVARRYSGLVRDISRFRLGLGFRVHEWCYRRLRFLRMASVLDVENPCLGHGNASMAAPLVEINQATGVKRDVAGLEGFAGWVLKASVVSSPLKNDALYVVECEIHTFGLTAVSSSPE